MKLHLLPIIFFSIFTLFGCKYQNANESEISGAKMDLESVIDKAFQKNGKYYVKGYKKSTLSGKSLISLEKELKIGDVLNGMQLFNEGPNYFTVKKFNKNSITFNYKSPPYNSGTIPSMKWKVGEFSIDCFAE